MMNAMKKRKSELERMGSTSLVVGIQKFNRSRKISWRWGYSSRGLKEVKDQDKNLLHTTGNSQQN